MSIEKENKEEVQEDVEVKDTSVEDAKNIGEEMAKAFADAISSKVKEVKKEVKEVPSKIITKGDIRVSQKDVPVGNFKSMKEVEVFAKAFIPRNVLEKFSNHKALTTYQNIETDADGGSFDPIDAKGLLADSVERYNSYVEDTLQVPIFNSVGTFIDHTGDATAYMIGEGAAITESKPSNTTRTITQKKIATLCPVTNEVFRFGTLADIANQSFESMGRAIAEKKQHLIFTADGGNNTTDGGITGIIPAINAVASNATEYIVAGTWADLSVTDLSLIVAAVAPWADSNKLAWYCNKKMWGYLEALGRTLGGNTYMLQTGQRPVPMLFGYPVKFANKMPSSQVDDETGLLFGDLSGAVATGSNGEVYVDSSSDFYFQEDVTCLRAIEHMGVTVYQPGTESAETSVIAVNFNSAS